MAEILDADVLFVVLVAHGLGNLDHLGEIEHPNIRFAVFLLDGHEVHLLVEVLVQNQPFLSRF